MTANDPFDFSGTPEELGRELLHELNYLHDDFVRDGVRIGKAHALIKVGASLEERIDVGGDTALMLAVTYKHTSIVRALIDAKANLDEKHSNGMTALMMAACGNDDGIIEALVDAGALLNEKDIYSKTALMYAAKNDSQSTAMEALIKARASLDEKDNDGMTALMYAARAQNLPCLKALIEAKANLDEEDEDGWTALMEGAADGNDEGAVEILAKAGAKLDEKNFDDGQTALMIAAKEGPASAVKALLEAGADFEIKDKEGKTALMLAEETLTELGDDSNPEAIKEFRNIASLLKDASTAKEKARHDAVAERQDNLRKQMPGFKLKP
jgi:ankyrin repeat protein